MASSNLTTETSGEYFLPEPGVEQQRLDLQHVLFRKALDGALCWAPVGEPARVLDIGTGTGIWARDFAKEHPGSDVTGSDLSAPAKTALPQNCRLVQADSDADDWTTAFYPHVRFDYVHLRMTISCFRDRAAVFARCFDHLNPGGWIELQDAELMARSDEGSARGCALERWCELMVRGTAAATAGFRNLLDTARYAEMLAAAGFVDVVERKVKVPWSAWSDDARLRELGRLQALNSARGGGGVSAKILGAAGLTAVEVDELLAGVKADMRNPDCHAYYYLYVVYGRKPDVKGT